MNEELTREINEEIDRLLESQEVLEEFEKVFPKEIVRADPKERPFEVNEENLGKIFDILNGMFFGNKLEKIPLLGMTFDEAVGYFNNVMINKYAKQDIEQLLGMHYSKLDVDTDNETLVTIPKSDFIYLQVKNDGKMSFGYVVATLMHEMIHYYDSDFGNLLHLHYLFLFKNDPYDMHETKIFRKYMTMARNKNILVKQDGEDKSFDELNKEAQKYFMDLPVGEIKKESNNGKKLGTYPITIKREDGLYDFFCP